MFDSPIHDWYPGDQYLFGCPYHGKITSDKAGNLTLNLPNGQKLKYPGYVFTTQGSSGLQWFRDPRATATERTPEQKKEDEQKGIEWRPDVLFDFDLRDVYGRRDWSYVQYAEAQWLFSDGAACYMVNIVRDAISSTPRVVLVPAPVLSRKPNKPFYDDELREKLETSISVDEDAFQYTSFKVADTVRDGSRAIVYGGNIALMGVSWKPSPNGTVSTPSAYWFEVAITTQVDEKTGKRTHAASITQLNKGYRLEFFNQGVGSFTGLWFSTNSETRSTSTMTETRHYSTYWRSETTNYNDSRGMVQAGVNGSSVYGYRSHNAVAGYYYNEDGEPQKIAFEIEVSTTTSASATLSGDYQDGEWVSYAPDYVEQVVKPPAGVTRGSGQGRTVDVATWRISGPSGSTSIRAVSTTTATDESIVDVVNGLRGNHGTRTTTQSLTVDGAVIHTASHFQDLGDSLAGSGGSNYPPGSSFIDFFDGHTYRFGVRFLGANAWQTVLAKTSNDLKTTEWTQTGAILHPSGPHGAATRYPGEAPDLYVSYNPITGEFAVSEQFVTFV